MDLLGRKATRNAALLVRVYEGMLTERNAVLQEVASRLENSRLRIIELEAELEKYTKPAIKNQSLYLNETEEDIEYAYKNELIDRAEYEDMLKQLEFDNASITFDLEAY